MLPTIATADAAPLWREEWERAAPSVRNSFLATQSDERLPDTETPPSCGVSSDVSESG